MSDGDLERAFGALREEAHGVHEAASDTLSRVLFESRRRAERRRRMVRLWVPLAAVLVGSTAWAAGGTRFADAVRAVVAPLSAPLHGVEPPPPARVVVSPATPSPQLADAVPVEPPPPADAAPPPPADAVLGAASPPTEPALVAASPPPPPPPPTEPALAAPSPPAIPTVAGATLGGPDPPSSLPSAAPALGRALASGAISPRPGAEMARAARPALARVGTPSPASPLAAAPRLATAPPAEVGGVPALTPATRALLSSGPATSARPPGVAPAPGGGMALGPGAAAAPGRSVAPAVGVAVTGPASGARSPGAVAEGPPAAVAPSEDPALRAETGLFERAHRAHFSGGDPAAALAAWSEYLRLYPKGRFAPEAGYNRALALVRAGRRGEACAALQPYAAGAGGGYRRREAGELLKALGCEVRRTPD